MKRRTDPSHPSIVRFGTRFLLTCAALGAVGAVLAAPLVPVLGGLAPASPPAYALVAGIYSVMPFVARLHTGLDGATVATALLMGILLAALSPVGLVILVPLLGAAVTVDGGLWLLERTPGLSSASRNVRFLLAAAAAGVVLFAVSLPVFSIDHLVPGILIATLVGRILAEIAAAIGALALVALLRRAGVRSPGRRRRSVADSGR